MKARERKAAGGAPRRWRKPRAEGAAAPAKIGARDDGDLLDALKAIEGLVSAHGVAQVHEMVDLLG
jgi:hypothetical protein